MKNDNIETVSVVLGEKQERLALLAEDIRTRMKRTALDIYHIGANLLEAQQMLFSWGIPTLD